MHVGAEGREGNFSKTESRPIARPSNRPLAIADIEKLGKITLIAGSIPT
jgi:hypothetical protein